MLDSKSIKAILFDVGGTLNYAASGNWFIPPNFFNYIDREKFENIDPLIMKQAFEKGIKYLLTNHLVLTEEEEYQAFARFYNIINEELGLDFSSQTISDLAKDNVFNDDKFIFYDDVPETLHKLSQCYMLGVVSDTWPSLDRVFINAKLRHYFSTFVMSSILGVCKPNELLYTTALTELDIKPNEALFIDDVKGNLHGATKLGIQTILIKRDNKSTNHESYYEGDYLCVDNIADIIKLIQESRPSFHQVAGLPMHSKE